MGRTCRWWESTRDFDQTKHYTDCFTKFVALSGLEDEIAALCWTISAEHCPFCGKVIDFCEEDEVIAEDDEETDYRWGVARGVYGY